MTPLRRGGSRRYLERSVDRLLRELEYLDRADRAAAGRGLLQGLDARVKVVGVLSLIVAVTLVTSIWAILAVLAGTVVLARASGLTPVVLATRVWLGVLAFTGALAVPALVLTPGEVAWQLPVAGWAVTSQGMRTAGLLLLRVEATATLAFVLVSTTPWTRLLKALRVLRVPDVLVVVLGMTARYAVLLLQAAHDMFDARRSRAGGAMAAGERRRMATATAGVLFARTLYLGNEVHLAMQARGFRGEVRVLDDRQLRARDWCGLAAFVGAAILVAWTGR